MPEPPVAVDSEGVLVVPPSASVDEDASPYQRIAADLRAAIRCGALRPGEFLPTLVELTARYGVSESTAHRAVALLADAGEITVSRGKRAVVAEPGGTTLAA